MSGESGGDLGHGLAVSPRLAEGDVDQPLLLVEPVVPEGQVSIRDGDGQEPAADRTGKAADLEDVGAVRPQLQVDLDRHLHRSVTHEAQPLGQPFRADDPVAADADRPARQLIGRMDLRVGVPVGTRVRHLDAAAEVRPDRRLEQDRSLAAHPQHGARQQPGVAAVQAQSAGVVVDVAERVGQQVQVGVLEQLHRAEVRGADDGRRPDRQEVDAVGRPRAGRRGRRLRRDRHEPFAPSPPVSSDRRSAWSAICSASMRSSMSPSMIPGRLCTVLPIRWSVTRSCGKL